MPRPLILYIPGLKPKPEPGVHRQQLMRCLLAGLGKVNPAIAGQVSASEGAFDLVSWTYDFYGEHRDLSLDKPAIDAVIAQREATARDRRDATSLRRRLLRGLYSLGDRLPFLIPSLADENVALHLRDLKRYAQNDNDVAESTRRHLKVPLRGAAASRRPVLLIAHSMGSVIAWDALWQLSRDPDFKGEISLFMTLGSPLGQHYIRRRLLGSDRQGDERFPHVIRQWVNVAAVGELTAINRELAGGYEEMVAAGLVESIEDVGTWNWYRDHGALNVHAEYGYLVNRDVARFIAKWWEEQEQAGASRKHRGSGFSRDSHDAR